VVPRLSDWSLRTPFGDLDATLEALLRGAVADPARLESRPLREQLADLLAPYRGSSWDGCLLATTKGDCPRWCDGLLAGSYHDGPAGLARNCGDLLGCEAHAITGACASGPLALGEAARRVRAGARRILVLGADRLAPFVVDGFAGLGALATGACRPFDVDRDGLRLGETLAAVAVTRDDGPVRLAGWGAGCDAGHLTAPDRDGAGLLAACRAACGDAAPDLIVAHGTGTRANDASEAAAYARGYPGVPVTGWKGALGHSLGPSGLSEAVLACALIADAAPVPGTVGLRQAIEGAEVLGPGAHPLRVHRVLSPNAGFGGIDAAVVLDDHDDEVESAAPSSGCTGRRRVVADADGLHVDGERRAWRHPVPGRLPAPRAREVLGRVDASWGRMDRLSRLVIACVRACDPPPGSALVLAGDTGCAETDRVFERGRRDGAVEPQRFPYTLPTTCLGEAAIRCGLRGPAFALAGADDDALRAAAARLLGDGHPAMVAIRAELDEGREGPVWAELWGKAEGRIRKPAAPG